MANPHSSSKPFRLNSKPYNPNHYQPSRTEANSPTIPREAGHNEGPNRKRPPSRSPEGDTRSKLSKSSRRDDRASAPTPSRTNTGVRFSPAPGSGPTHDPRRRTSAKMQQDPRRKVLSDESHLDSPVAKGTSDESLSTYPVSPVQIETKPPAAVMTLVPNRSVNMDGETPDDVTRSNQSQYTLLELRSHVKSYLNERVSWESRKHAANLQVARADREFALDKEISDHYPSMKEKHTAFRDSTRRQLEVIEADEPELDAHLDELIRCSLAAFNEYVLAQGPQIQMVAGEAPPDLEKLKAKAGEPQNLEHAVPQLSHRMTDHKDVDKLTKSFEEPRSEPLARRIEELEMNQKDITTIEERFGIFQKEQDEKDEIVDQEIQKKIEPLEENVQVLTEQSKNYSGQITKIERQITKLDGHVTSQDKTLIYALRVIEDVGRENISMREKLEKFEKFSRETQNKLNQIEIYQDRISASIWALQSLSRVHTGPPKDPEQALPNDVEDPPQQGFGYVQQGGVADPPGNSDETLQQCDTGGSLQIYGAQQVPPYASSHSHTLQRALSDQTGGSADPQKPPYYSSILAIRTPPKGEERATNGILNDKLETTGVMDPHVEETFQKTIDELVRRQEALKQEKDEEGKNMRDIIRKLEAKVEENTKAYQSSCEELRKAVTDSLARMKSKSNEMSEMSAELEIAKTNLNVGKQVVEQMARDIHALQTDNHEFKNEIKRLKGPAASSDDVLVSPDTG